MRKTAGGYKFKAALQDKGWTQTKAAHELSKVKRHLPFSTPYVSKLVNNREAPGRARALVIKQVLGVEVEVW